MTIAKILYGSHLYGTSTPESDTDFRGIYLPSLRDCLLGTVKDTVTDTTEEDTQYYSLPYFLRLASQGQSVAIEMLSAPESAIVTDSDIWQRLRAEKARFYTRNMKSFLGFAKSQAGKYSSRAERLNEVEVILAVLRRPDTISCEQRRLGEIWGELPESTNAVKTINERNTNTDKRAYVVCGRELQATVTVWHAYQVIETIRDGYGERVRNAKEGKIDWKSLAHAFRVASQARDIVTTGKLTYPLHNADYLREMRLGRIDFMENRLDERLDNLILEVQTLMEESSLPEKVDQSWCDQFVLMSCEREFGLHIPGDPTVSPGAYRVQELSL